MCPATQSVTMSKFFVVFVAILACVVAKRQKLSVVADLAGESTGHISSISFGEHYSSHGDKKYASAKELTALAHSSAQQARSAVRNQQSAGLQAAVGTQSGFARAAQGAASAAQVAQVASQVIVQQLQEQYDEAARQLEDERGLFQKFLEAASAAQDTVQQTQEQSAAIAAALATTQQAGNQAEAVAALAGQAAAAQHQMIQDAEQRLAKLHERLEEALAGHYQTEQATQRAAAAANTAQNNAAASAQLAVANSATSQIDEHGSEYHR